MNDVVVSCTLKEHEGGEAQVPNISLPMGRIPEAQTEPSSPPAVEEASASDYGPGAPSASNADGVDTHCMTGASILPAEMGSASSAVRDDERGMSRQEPLQSNAASTDGDLPQLPSVENGTNRHLAAFRSDSTASSAPETGKARESPAVSSYLPASKLQEAQAIQVTAAFRPGSAVGYAALSGPRDTEETPLVVDPDGVGEWYIFVVCRSIDLITDDATIDDTHFRDEEDGGVETRGSSGGLEHIGTTSGEVYAHRQDARSTAALTTTATSSGRADEPETGQVVILEDNHGKSRRCCAAYRVSS